MECKDLIHPFQNDPGISQRQRVMDDLLSGSAKIDGRNIADLLNYFIQLSRHINYYDSNLNITDWQKFFQASLPFTISEIVKYDKNKVQDKLAFYNELFDKKPGKASLQLLLRYIYYTLIKPVNTWSLKLKDSGLPVELLLNKLITDKLNQPLKLFIIYLNAGVKWYNVTPFSFNNLLENDAWNLDLADSYANFDSDAFKAKGTNKRKRLIWLRNELVQVVPSFLDIIQTIGDTAELDMEQSFFPLKEELKEKHTPHLALLFSFLKLFKYLQGDLNKYTKKHLDFFYKEVLCLKAKQAIPDKAHLVFEIQNQLNKYLLNKGLLIKDGKDSNKAEVLFSLDDEIVVNKAQVADKRTLFINNQIHGDNVYVEGIYIAPDAGKADGVIKEFKDDAPANWPTLGAHYSKYKDPENNFIKPYPNARLGFVLASPVLLLKEGDRQITITLSCMLIDDYCSSLSPAVPNRTHPCCQDNDDSVFPLKKAKKNNQAFFNATELYGKVQTALSQTFYYINRDMIALAWKKGISKDLKESLDKALIKKSEPGKERLCYCPTEVLLYENSLTEAQFNQLIPNADERKMLADIFKPAKALSILFSGEKGWVSPAEVPLITLSPLAANGAFKIFITAKLLPEQPAVTFYNAEALKEDLNTPLPVVKIELDDKIKCQQGIEASVAEECCERKSNVKNQLVSLYHFFRNVKVSADNDTKIEVSVCGLKNFIVQNDESIQNVNGPVYPFGTRPEVVDFDIKAPPSLNTTLNLIGPNFYIGSKEVFCKKWNDIYINLEWKDKPTNFRDYYKGYLKDGGLFGLDENKFLVNLSVLEDGQWKKEKKHLVPATVDVQIQGTAFNDRRLFENNGKSAVCVQKNPFPQTIHLNKAFFDLQQQFLVDNKPFVKYDVDAFNGFMKVNLQIQDFCHKVYSYVLARQMMALGKLPDSKLEDAIYYDQLSGNLIVFNTNTIKDDLIAADVIADRVVTDVNNNPNGIINKIGNQLTGGTINAANADSIRETVFPKDLIHTTNKNLTGDVTELKNKITGISTIIGNTDKFQAVIPNEPWTPVIKNISIDYTATATIQDIDLIHLYPYQNTYKNEELELQPALFPTFCDEGNLFIGLKGLQPGSNLNLLFQLAEATADSESERVAVQWYYLENNIWKQLRKGFELLEDETDGLTTSGIIKLALPANMTNENTILPKGLHWIKVAIANSSASVSSTISIYTQAIRATFTNDILNDKLRLSKPLPAGSLTKLNEADSSIKKVNQPFDSFGGRVSEEEGHFYVRVSELLRHKGRAIQKFDYERLALEAFPQLYKVKCINHSFALNAHHYQNDVPMAPGYVLLAVIPDLTQLKAAQEFEPTVPVGLMDKVREYLIQRSSPFVRLQIMNPRYEKVNFCLKVKLYPGKDESFYKEKLKQDLKEFLAPWAIGQYDKLTFGQCINQSDIVGFLETLGYLDYVIELRMQHEEQDSDIRLSVKKQICPISPRSILIAGDIDVCILQQDCESWGNTRQYPTCTNQSMPIENYCND
jgi:hypothetical protein